MDDKPIRAGWVKMSAFQLLNREMGFDMARITVEDCMKHIPNRFQLALAAAYRARQLAQGHTPKIDTKDKPTVAALREIAAQKVGIEMLRKVPT